jgi:hypothetical protein
VLDQLQGDDSKTNSINADDTVLLMLKNQETRIESLESDSKKTSFKRLTESASASALFLGLVLTFVSLYDAFVTKPESDRINRLSQFNQAIISAVKTRQEFIQAQGKTKDPRLQLALASSATQQMLTDVSTAKALLRDIKDRDIAVPQLLMLIEAAFGAGDLESARNFVFRAVNRSDNTPFFQSEAKRYEGKYLFAIGDPAGGRQAFLNAVKAFGDSNTSMQARAYVLSDLVQVEFQFGNCDNAATDFQSFVSIVHSPYVSPDARSQLITTTKYALDQLQGQHCTTPQNLDGILSK